MASAAPPSAGGRLQRGSVTDPDLPAPGEYTVYTVAPDRRLFDLAKSACAETGADLTGISVRSTREYVGSLAAQVLGGPARRVVTGADARPTVALDAVPATLSAAERDAAPATVPLECYRVEPATLRADAVYVGHLDAPDDVPDAVACHVAGVRAVGVAGRLPKNARRLLDRLLGYLTARPSAERTRALRAP